MDAETSPCIDAGIPWVRPDAEPMPNGGQVNAGAHGNTPYASRSPWPILGDVNYDGIFDMEDVAITAQYWLKSLPWAQ